MTKQEFKALTKRSFTDSAYTDIETVYTFHPCIKMCIRDRCTDRSVFQKGERRLAIS